jgi:hypothetical protein
MIRARSLVQFFAVEISRLRFQIGDFEVESGAAAVADTVADAVLAVPGKIHSSLHAQNSRRILGILCQGGVGAM